MSREKVSGFIKISIHICLPRIPELFELRCEVRKLLQIHFLKEIPGKEIKSLIARLRQLRGPITKSANQNAFLPVSYIVMV